MRRCRVRVCRDKETQSKPARHAPPHREKSMKTNISDRIQWIHTGAWLPTLVLVAASTASALADDNRAPDVPAAIAVPAGNKVHFHGFGVGVQIYTWNGSSWGTAVPEATLIDDEGNIVAIHFAGPTWQSDSGS